MLIICLQSEIAVGARTAAPSVRDDIVSEIYRAVGGPSGIINELLKRVEFNALSVLLLAATASRNAWSHHQLAKEWDIQRAHLSRTDCDETLAATIELSLASPAFRELGPDARDLLEVVAFFPQGVDEKNLDWLFPTISDKKKILDEFFALSLTHRNNGFVTLLAPVRDYLRPRDPKSSPLLCAIKDRYFARLSVDVDPGKPGFEEARWIKSEDRNVEHLLDVFTSIDANSDVVWDVCANFMRHLYWFKQRHTVLGLKVERLPDDHPSRLKCLLELSWLYRSVGNYAEQKRLLTCVLELWRERGDDYQVARLLCDLSGINRQLGLVKEGIQRAEEAMEIYERLGNTAYQASCLNDLARSLYTGNRLNDAEETVSRAFSLPEKGREVADSRSHRTLGALYSSKGEREKAIHHFKTALEIASTLGRRDHQFWNHLSLATLCSDANEFDDAHTHIEQAKSYTVDDIYHMGSAFMLQAEVFYRQRRLEDAKSAASRALGIYEELAAEKRLWECKALIQDIERAISGELQEKKPLLMPINLPFHSARPTIQDFYLFPHFALLQTGEMRSPLSWCKHLSIFLSTRPPGHPIRQRGVFRRRHFLFSHGHSLLY